MNTLWTKGLRKGSQDIKDVQEAYASSAFLRKYLVKILQEMESQELKSSLNASNYESPSWALKQADTIGYARALRKIADFLVDKP